MPTPTTTWRATSTSTRNGIIPQVLPNEMMTVVRTKKELSRLPAIVHGRDITAMNKKINDRLLEEYKFKCNISSEVEDGIVLHTTKVNNRGRCTNPNNDKRTIAYKRRMLEEDGSAARRNEKESRNDMPTPTTTASASARDGNIPQVLQASNDNITTGKQQKYITVFTCDICKGEESVCDARSQFMYVFDNHETLISNSNFLSLPNFQLQDFHQSKMLKPMREHVLLLVLLLNTRTK